METLREKLLKIHKSNYEKGIKLIKESLGLKKSFMNYANEYHSFLKNYESISTPSDLFRKLAASNLIFVGDYHTLANSQKAVLRILKEINAKRETILCLEMFHSVDQKWIDMYLESNVSENEFLKQIDYWKKWGYNWNHWKLIVDFCKENHIPILGINSEQKETRNPLKQRDIHSSQIIAKTFIKNPDKLILIVDGDFHIAPDHLPKEIQKRLKMLDVDFTYTIVYQNSESIYWKLAKEGLEEEDVLKIDSNSYCVMNTIPTNKIQSYLNWLEYSEDAYYPRNWKWDESKQQEGGYSVPNIVKTICKILDLPYPEDKLNRLTIYYANNLDFIRVVEEIDELRPTLPLIMEKMKNNEGFLLEYQKNGNDLYLIYLANTSLSMAAEEAAHFINVALRTSFRGEISNFDRFYQNVLMEAIGFYGSKLIVPKRRKNNISDLRRFIGQFKHEKLKPGIKTKVKISRFILQHHHLERQTGYHEDFKIKFHALYKTRSHLSHVVSTQLGYILGSQIYNAVHKGILPSEEIKVLFYQAFSMPEEAFRVFINLNTRLRIKRKSLANKK